MDGIYLKNIIAAGHHGANPGEKDQAQRFKISVELEFDVLPAASSDDLGDTLDWSKLHTDIINTVEQTSYDLTERLAKEIADRLLRDSRVKAVTVAIDKLEAFDNGVPGVRLTLQNK